MDTGIDNDVVFCQIVFGGTAEKELRRLGVSGGVVPVEETVPDRGVL